MVVNGKIKAGSLVAIVIVAFVMFLFYIYGRGYWVPVMHKVVGKQTVADVLVAVGADARARLKPFFRQAGVAYPPQQIHLLAVKDKSVLELWTGPASSPVFIKKFSVKAASGVAGPKLQEGDKQVPEGIYKLTGLNPNSSFHLSMQLNYPNAFDLKHASAEARTSPGSDIFIHGKAVSVGCLAMGDTAIEDLFVLAADTGIDHVSVVIAPTDPRDGGLVYAGNKAWVNTLYSQIEKEFSNYRR